MNGLFILICGLVALALGINPGFFMRLIEIPEGPIPLFIRALCVLLGIIAILAVIMPKPEPKKKSENT